MIPEHTRALLLSGEVPLSSVLLTLDWECHGSKFHSPQPLLLRPYSVQPYGLVTIELDDTEAENRAWLCGVCADNLSVYLSLLVFRDGKLPWEVRREFGNRIRRLAEMAWPQEESA